MKKIFIAFVSLALIFSSSYGQQKKSGAIPTSRFGTPPMNAPTNFPSPSFSPSTMGGNSSKPSFGGDTTLPENVKERFSKAQPEDITDENFPQIIESFDYPNADITDIVKAISELTGKNFIVDPGVRGKITIIAPSRITVAEAYKAFLSSLAINGFTIVPSGKFLKIRQARNAQRDSIETYSGDYYPNSDMMITRIIQLKYLSADQVNKDLRILPSKDGEMTVYSSTNSIILSDYGSNIERVMKIIAKLDQPGFEDQMEVVPIRYAKAKDIADLIDQIINKNESSKSQKGSRGSFSSGIPRFGVTHNDRSSTQAYFMVIPDDRTNSLIITGNISGLKKIKKLISQLDFKIRPEEAGGVQVYYVKHGNAEKISQTLSGIAKEGTPKNSTSNMGIPGAVGLANESQQVFGGDVKITADKETNSLIITASKQDYEVILNLLAKIDIPRDQVYVEAIIMEMLLSDTGSWGVGYYKFLDSSGIAKQGFNGFGSDLQSLLTPIGGKGAILGFGSGDKISINLSGTTTTISSLVGFVNFLKQNARTNILSTPQILALANEESLIEVGDRVPTSTASTTGANGVTSSNVTFEDATIKLKVKPFISPATNTIRMEVKQDIKQPSAAQPSAEALAKAAIILTTRKLESNVVVRSGDTVVLGGLIRDSEIETVTKVPLLGDIPIIGWLFKARSTKVEKTNLLVFLTPHIVRNTEDRNQILSKKLDERIDFVKAAGGRDPYGATLERIAKQAGVNNPSTEEPKKSEENSTETLPEAVPPAESTHESLPQEEPKELNPQDEPSQDFSPDQIPTGDEGL